MITEFEYVDLVFENCNYVHLLPEHIYFLDLSEITEDIFINVSQQYTEVKNCKKFTIELFIEALEIKTWFEEEFDTAESFENHLNVYKDITCVSIKPINKEKFCVGVPWESGNDHDNMNTLQETKIENGRILITCQYK